MSFILHAHDNNRARQTGFNMTGWARKDLTETGQINTHFFEKIMHEGAS